MNNNKLNLNDVKILQKINTCSKKFYNKHYIFFKNEAYDYEDFKQTLFLKLLNIKVNKELYSEGFLMLCLYCKMKYILNNLKKKTFDINNVELFWQNNINELEHIKNFLMDVLTFKEASIIINRVFDNNTFKDIGNSLGCTKQNIHYHYLRALKKLKQNQLGK